MFHTARFLLFAPISNSPAYFLIMAMLLLEDNKRQENADAAVDNAEACGMEKYMGSLEKGRLADLLILKADPTESPGALCRIENIECVIMDGKLTVEAGRFAW